VRYLFATKLLQNYGNLRHLLESKILFLLLSKDILLMGQSFRREVGFIIQDIAYVGQVS
jgi:hypothetical protein